MQTAKIKRRVKGELLVYKIVWQILRRYPHGEIDDLFQEGYLAYLVAVNNFDPEKGEEAFKSYAWYCIHGSLLKHMDPIPEDRHESLGDWLQVTSENNTAFFEEFSPTTREAIDCMMTCLRPLLTVQQAADMLLEQGYCWADIWLAFREIKSALR